MTVEAQEPVTPSSPATAVYESGRFQFISEDGTWLLDTASGDIWRWECSQYRTIQPTGVRVCDGDEQWVHKPLGM